VQKIGSVRVKDEGEFIMTKLQNTMSMEEIVRSAPDWTLSKKDLPAGYSHYAGYNFKDFYALASVQVPEPIKEKVIIDAVNRQWKKRLKNCRFYNVYRDHSYKIRCIESTSEVFQLYEELKFHKEYVSVLGVKIKIHDIPLYPFAPWIDDVSTVSDRIARAKILHPDQKIVVPQVWAIEQISAGQNVSGLIMATKPWSGYYSYRVLLNLDSLKITKKYISIGDNIVYFNLLKYSKIPHEDTETFLKSLRNKIIEKNKIKILVHKKGAGIETIVSSGKYVLFSRCYQNYTEAVKDIKTNFPRDWDTLEKKLLKKIESHQRRCQK